MENYADTVHELMAHGRELERIIGKAKSIGDRVATIRLLQELLEVVRSLSLMKASILPEGLAVGKKSH